MYDGTPVKTPINHPDLTPWYPSIEQCVKRYNTVHASVAPVEVIATGGQNNQLVLNYIHSVASSGENITVRIFADEKKISTKFANRKNKMNHKIAAGLLVLSALFSSWLYWGSDLKVEQVLISKEWQSRMVTLITDSLREESVGSLRRVTVDSNVKYLPNGQYNRFATVKLYGNDTKNESVINISEEGEWDISDNYLLVSMGHI